LTEAIFIFGFVRVRLVETLTAAVRDEVAAEGPQRAALYTRLALLRGWNRCRAGSVSMDETPTLRERSCRARMVDALCRPL